MSDDFVFPPANTNSTLEHPRLTLDQPTNAKGKGKELTNIDEEISGHSNLDFHVRFYSAHSEVPHNLI